MTKQIITIVLSLLIGFGAGYVAFNMQGHSSGATAMDSNTMHQANMAADAMHKEVEVDPQLPIPAVTVSATPDSNDGHNLRIEVTNFTFTPDKAGMGNEPNTGHAHIYVNGEKLGRIYGEWFFLSNKYLKEGENIVAISLNGNDHSDWLVNGEHIESLVTVIK